MTRELVVVDLETTSLNMKTAVPLEVAVVNVTTGESFEFVPRVSMETIGTAEPTALAVNRYFERRLFEKQLGVNETTNAYGRVADMLEGNTLAGANPRYDAAVLLHALAESDFEIDVEPWHYRLADLSAYTAGALGLEPSATPGLAKCCELLGVELDPAVAHTAIGDALATAECFRVVTELHAARAADAEGPTQ